MSHSTKSTKISQTRLFHLTTKCLCGRVEGLRGPYLARRPWFGDPCFFKQRKSLTLKAVSNEPASTWSTGSCELLHQTWVCDVPVRHRSDSRQLLLGTPRNTSVRGVILRRQSRSIKGHLQWRASLVRLILSLSQRRSLPGVTDTRPGVFIQSTFELLSLFTSVQKCTASEWIDSFQTNVETDRNDLPVTHDTFRRK